MFTVLLKRCLNDSFFQGLVKSNPVIHELWRFGKYLLGEFFKLAQTNQKLPIEVLFWIKGREVDRIQNNHYEKVKLPAKSSVWTDDAEVSFFGFMDTLLYDLPI